MSISSISSNSASSLQGATLTPAQAAAQQTAQALKALETALQQGNVSAAQTALTSLQKVIQNSPQGQSASGSQSPSGNAVTQALQAVQTALQSGDISSAQTATSALQSALKGSGHHHHHHGGSSATDPAETSSTTADTSTSSAGSILNDLA